MPAELEITDASEIPQLLALDESSCALCGPTDKAAARASLGELASWWLDPAQRDSWGVQTRIDGTRRPDGAACDALFKILLPSRPNALSVFFVLTQHWDRKHYPHYQLQIPARADLQSAAGPGAERKLARLIDATDSRVAYLRVSGKMSISLHEPLPTVEMDRVKSALADLVIGLRDIL